MTPSDFFSQSFEYCTTCIRRCFYKFQSTPLDIILYVPLNRVDLLNKLILNQKKILKK
jgi:hypothetical protein